MIISLFLLVAFGVVRSRPWSALKRIREVSSVASGSHAFHCLQAGPFTGIVMMKLPAGLDILQCAFHHTYVMDLERFVPWAKSRIGQTQDSVHKRMVQRGKAVKQAEGVRVKDVQK